MKKTIYKVYEITGEYAIAADNGQKVYDLIYPILLAGDSVELDFAEVQIFASAFFNVAIGQLLRDLSPESLNCLLSFKSLNSSGEKVLDHIIANAKRYYSDPKYQQAVDAVMEEYSSSLNA